MVKPPHALAARAAAHVSPLPMRRHHCKPDRDEAGGHRAAASCAASDRLHALSTPSWQWLHQPPLLHGDPRHPPAQPPIHHPTTDSPSSLPHLSPQIAFPPLPSSPYPPLLSLRWAMRALNYATLNSTSLFLCHPPLLPPYPIPSHRTPSPPRPRMPPLYASPLRR